MGGYGLLLAASRGPVPTSPPAPPLDPPPEIPDPERLPRLRIAQPASVTRARDEDAHFTVEVLVTGARQGEAAGVAVLDGRNGAPLAWCALADGQETPEGLRVRLPGVPEGLHVAALAAAPDRARYHYRAKAELTVSGEERPEPPVLDARTQDVTVRTVLPGRPEDALPPIFRLGRVDDPMWRPALTAEGVDEEPMVVPTGGGVLHLSGLGPGRYTLKPLDGRYEAFEFDVPGPESITATCRRLEE